MICKADNLAHGLGHDKPKYEEILKKASENKVLVEKILERIV